MTGNQILTFAARTLRARWVGLSIAVVASFVVSTACGQVIFDSQGFEAPNYSTTFPPAGPDAGSGILEGQPNPLNIVTPDVWRKSQDPGTSKAIVQSAVKLTGNQAVKLTRRCEFEHSVGHPALRGQPANGAICVHRLGHESGRPGRRPELAVWSVFWHPSVR